MDYVTYTAEDKMGYTLPLLMYNDDEFYLARDFYYVFEQTDAFYEYIKVPQGFATDFATIHWTFRWLISPIDKHLVSAAIVHDYLVQSEEKGFGKPIIIRVSLDTGKRSEEVVTWEKASAIMRTIMKEQKAPVWKRQVVYLATRVWGILKGK